MLRLTKLFEELEYNSLTHRKKGGRLDHYNVSEHEKHKKGKASLAEIFFQKLFGKRRASQNNSYRAYSINYKYTYHTAYIEQ